MNSDSAIVQQAHADAAVESMRQNDIPPNPRTFTVWDEYHAGRNADLKRTIDIIVSNDRPFDERVLHDLYEDFFTSTKEEHALHSVSVRVRDTLDEVLSLVATASSDAARFGVSLHDASTEIVSPINPLAALIERLLDESREMARRSERLGNRLHQSMQTIKTLETTLEDARREATTDSLTGVANRRAFDAALRATAGDAMNSGDDLSLLMVDIDRFKSLNDTWGHQTGDEVLRLLAGLLRQNVRVGDIPARYGGEEFAVILPTTSLESAVAVGNHIRIACEVHQFLPLGIEQPVPMPTVSIGASRYEPGEALANWVRRADAALYSAKHGGRNRVVSE